MLRPVKSPNRRARILAVAATTAGSAANTIQVGSEEGTFTNASADEQLDIALREPFHRAPIVLAAAGASIGAGGTAIVSAAATASSVSVETINGAGSADVGGVEALILGFDSSITEISAKKENLFDILHATFRNARIVSGQVDTDGTKLIGGSAFTSVKNATGDYTITFSRPFGRTPVVIPTVFTAGASAKVVSKTVGTVNITTFDAANSAADVKFNFVAFGSSTQQENRSLRGGEVETSFRKPRIFGGRVDYDTGTPSIVIGTGLFTITDTGDGLLDIEFVEAFGREPIVIACCHTTAGWASLTGASSLTTGCQINTTDEAGVDADPTGVYFLVIGSDDSVEY